MHRARVACTLALRLATPRRVQRVLTVPVAPARLIRPARTMSSSSAATTSVGPSGLDTLPDVQRHSPRVCSVLGQNPSAMTLQGTNCYVIGSGSHRILIDTGEGMPAYAAILRDWLQTEKVTQLTILLTHWHADHTGGVKSVCELFDSAHQPHIYKFGGADLIPSSVLRAFPELATRVQPMLDGQEFAVEGATLRAIHTPGHTTDHCIFELLEERAVISGDNVLGASTAVFSDLHSYMHSLRRIAQCQPQRIYPAHGPIIDGAEAPKRVEQYMQHRLQREGQILQAMKDIASESHAEADHKDPTAVELVQRIYVGLSPTLLFAAANNVLLHLDKLLREQKVRAIELPNEDDSAATAAIAAATGNHNTDNEDDCHAEVAKLHAIARQRSSWRWQIAS